MKKKINLHKYHLSNYYKLETINKNKNTWLLNQLKKCSKKISDILKLTNTIYNKGYNALDILIILNKLNIDKNILHEKMFCFHKFKREFKNEQHFIFLILNFILISPEFNLENKLLI